MMLWYTNSATDWKDALPIGSGKLAAMVFGGITSEQIQFNEDTIWTGQPHDYAHAGASNYLAQIQSLVFAGQGSAAWTVAQPNFMSMPLRQCAYQPGGDLFLSFAHAGATGYKRWLDLDRATACVTYTHSGTVYNREVFASQPDNVIVIRLTADQPGKISFSATFSSIHTGEIVSTSGDDLVMRVNVPNAANGLTSLVQFQARVRILNEGGTLSAGGTSASVSNADAVTLLLSIASNVLNYDNVGGNPAVIASNTLVNAAAKSYSELRQAQLDDYQPLFRRVVLDLGTSTLTNLPTNLRVPAVRTNTDPQLAALLFQMGRYLLLATSRPGSEPSNLQGKWNNNLTPNWESKMTLNINQEMNYWATEAVNLAECHEPLFEMIAELSVTGQSVARTHYNADGWVAHHNTDLWRGAAPINGQDGLWPTGGAFICQHLWWRFEFSRDTNFLATVAYPVLKGAAQFFEDFLIPHPTYTNWWVTNPSHSPEQPNPALGANGSIIAGPTMDNQLVRELFTRVIEAGEILGVDAAFRTNLIQLRTRLPPNQIGSNGQLQEWLEDVDQVNNGHRHMSPLVGLFPGDEITGFYNPIICQAAKVLVDWRGDAPNEKGWSKAWRMCLRNRLQDGNRAYLLFTNAVARNLTANMTYNASDQQIDLAFGLLAGIAETMLQSHAGELFLLPALPAAWTNGSVAGLRARGGFDVAIQWQSNKLASATILSRLGSTCRVRSKWPLNVMLGANDIAAPMILPGLYEFPTSPGSSYTILPANIVETELLSFTLSSGGSHIATTNLAFSNFRGTRLNANAAGDFVAYTVTNLAAGNYRIQVGADAGNDRGRFQLACGPSGGTLINVGPVQDTYSPTNIIYHLHTNSIARVALATNLLRELDCGAWLVPSNGNYSLRFTVVDKHAGSSGYSLVFDYIKLTPVAAAPPPALAAAVQDGFLVLSWPASAVGFSLEHATSLPATAWTPAAPLPVVVEGFNVVTNSLDADKAFYRLHKP